ncbi:hypothetical protein CRENPOLYSF2_1970005 [Crenothrix polyspora]|uniref:DUF433 domain-containing protein n=1 Tax=Crenothrix polyspora TaxID=360316 RepID=A0A1R4H3Y5_9GAMM|nr:DUF433 domain-containing protein [Crenothrix polyspora]SJM90962.1 hypothetical protein CRENPOLYSF2_1970005 [Crenothrix polyspora]
MSEPHRITTDPQICGGRPCIRNMRIRVKDILDLLASGANSEEILEDYPYLEADAMTLKRLCNMPHSKWIILF